MIDYSIMLSLLLDKHMHINRLRNLTGIKRKMLRLYESGVYPCAEHRDAIEAVAVDFLTVAQCERCGMSWNQMECAM